MPVSARRLWERPGFCPLLIALAAWLVIVAAIDPAGEFPRAWQGPGLTVDESFNVGQGVLLADRMIGGDLDGFCAASGNLPDHPPLGRLWIGVCHELIYPAFAHPNPAVPYSVACARPASAFAFAVLVFIVGCVAGRWYGAWAGAMAALAIVLMPRVFGHAHLAALETAINLAYTATVLYLAQRWGDAEPPTPRTAFIGGCLFGLALLTKIQSVLLPVPIAIWSVCVWKKRALVPLALWGLAAILVFYAGWPWLWDAPVAHLKQYLGRTTDRGSISVWYLGRAIADRDVPWHYPWVMFLTTVPAGLHLLGAWGLFGGDLPAWKSRRETLLLACIGFPLLVFSIPGVAVYDGERLFSVVFPLWAVFVGRGAANALRQLTTWLSTNRARWVLAVFMAGQSYGIIAFAPCYLSYYNLLTGGLAGAERLGFQVTYWGDSITRNLLRQTVEERAAGSSIQVFMAPVLHQFQLRALEQQSPLLLAGLENPIAPYSAQAVQSVLNREHGPRVFVLVFQRKEYLPRELQQPPSGARVVAEVRRQGVLLAAFYELQTVP